jgi:hypothetical protein
MLQTRLSSSFKLVDEKHSHAFERFANSFLVDDYPEIDPLGGKKDGGIDGRLFFDNDELFLVVQSCVSPVERATTKINDTIKKLEKIGYPKFLIYCSPANIGLKLDNLKKEVRKKFKIVLEICDGAWFVQRAFISHNRKNLSESFSEEILAPFNQIIKPNEIYSGFLSEENQRIAISYFEAQNLEVKSGQNLTKSLFDSFLAYALKDSEPPQKIYSMNEIIEMVSKFLPPAHLSRVKEIIPGRVEALVNKGLMRIHRPQNKYVLSFPFRDEFKNKIKILEDSEFQFLGEITKCLTETVIEKEIDYAYEKYNLPLLVQKIILWFMKNQGEKFLDPYSEVINVLNAESLVERYLKEINPQLLNKKEDREIIFDLVPHTLFKVINSKNNEIPSYLRRKADLFIIGSLMQISPDVQECCKNLLGNDHFYLDTTVLIKCAAEYFMPPEMQHFLKALRNAKAIGIKIKTFQTCIQEVVSHIQGPIYLEWINNFKGKPHEEIEESLHLQPTLFKVFYFVEKNGGSKFEKSINSIIGQDNYIENVVEFFEKELNIVCEPHKIFKSAEANKEWQEIFGIWLEIKRKKLTMSQSKFELLVKNDVNSFMSIVELRKENKIDGSNYGEKIWFLTTDQVTWRIPKIMKKEQDHLYQVSMSLDYLLNYVSTITKNIKPLSYESVSPFGCIFDATATLPSEMRDFVINSRKNSQGPKYLTERRIRDEVQRLKATKPTEKRAEEIVEFQPDEEIEVKSM